MSYEYGFNGTIRMTGLDASKDRNINLTLSGNGSTDLTANEMQLTGAMKIDSGPSQGQISIPLDLYLVIGWQYIKFSLFGVEEWTKSRVEMNSYDAADVKIGAEYTRNFIFPSGYYF